MSQSRPQFVDFLTHDYGSYTISSIVAPNLVQSLLETLAKHKLLKRHHLHLLIKQNLSRLDLSCLRPVSNHATIARLVKHQCSNLTELNLAGCKQISTQLLAGMAESFPSMKSLNLSGTKCTDHVLTTLGHHCPHLRDLRLSGCPVTDKGAINFCSTTSRRTGARAQLVRLDVDHTRVGIPGLQVVLSNIATLQWLSHHMTCAAVGELHKHDKDQQVAANKYYQLRNLQLQDNCSSAHQRHAWLHTACELCPHVTTVQMVCSTSHVAPSLGTLTELRSLDLVEEESADLEEQVLRLLQIRGPKLRHLRLSDLTRVDLQVLGRTCPNLVHLTLAYTNGEMTFLDNSHAGLSCSQPSSTVHPFSRLVELNLLVCAGSNLTSSMLLNLLLCCDQLKTLTLSGLDTALTDQLLAELKQADGLARVETVNLSRCNSFTGEGLLPWLQLSTSLTEMTLTDCHQVTRAWYEQVLAFIAENRIPMTLIWS